MNEERRRKWTEEEDEQLLAILNTYPGNNEYCFKNEKSAFLCYNFLI